MNEIFGIVTSEHCYIRHAPGSSENENQSGIEDEIFSGWAVRIFQETEKNGWVKIETHYGYTGYIRKSEIRLTEKEELQKRQDKERFFHMGIAAADLLDQPKVQGLPEEFILKDAIVELLEKEKTDGWSRIRTAAGREGYVHTRYLVERKDDDGYLLEGWGEALYFRRHFQNQVLDEETFRESLALSAKSYLGVQYRWGGKSSQGLDCSGLVFMSYLENGVLIYRDAKIMPEYPMNEVSREELKMGDLIFFPGHVAMYLGDRRYIHSTAFKDNACVTINSLDPANELYRDDLAHRITGYGSIFTSYGQIKNGDRRTRVRKAIWEKLEKRLQSLPGNVSVVYKNLDQGDSFLYRAGERHIAASVIKLFLMAAVFQNFEDGRLHETDRITVRRSDCVPSCGVLNYLSEEQTMSIRDLVELMIIVSDNTATNVLFDLAGRERVNWFLQRQLGVDNTVFGRKMFDSESAAKGIENYVTAADVARLLEGIYRGGVVSGKASGEMYRILTHQRLNGKIPFYLHTLPDAPVIAHKTGEDCGTTHDVAIIEGKSPFVLCFLGNETNVPAYEELMAETALEIYQALNQDDGDMRGGKK